MNYTFYWIDLPDFRIPTLKSSQSSPDLSCMLISHTLPGNLFAVHLFVKICLAVCLRLVDEGKEPKLQMNSKRLTICVKNHHLVPFPEINLIWCHMGSFPIGFQIPS